jgi:cytosine/adenosine deaminase-related metal-dependent hydrolase
MSGLFGMHALMTLGTKTLQRCAEIGHSLGTGFHVHAAEDKVDAERTMERYGRRIMERFQDFEIAGEKTIFVHGSYLEPQAMEYLHASGSMLVINPESNMNNGLRVAPALDFLQHGIDVGLGTDGMSGHLVSQARAIYLHERTRQRDPAVGFSEACRILLENNRSIANRLFDEPRGVLAPGQLADIMIADYQPFTPLNADTFYGHLLFGLGFAPLRTTIARGRVILDEGRLPHLDEASIRARGVERAKRLWGRIQ